MGWYTGIAVSLIAGWCVLIAVLDWRARHLARRYCAERGIAVIKVKTWKNAHGIYFQIDGKQKYARFGATWSKLLWEGQSPEEMIAESNNEDPTSPSTRTQ
jgi:hypothetical protein